MLDGSLNTFTNSVTQTTDTYTDVLDTTGLACPLPLLKLKQWLKQAPSANIVKLIATDMNSQRDITRYCGISGHQLLSSIVAPVANIPEKNNLNAETESNSNSATMRRTPTQYIFFIQKSV